MTKSFLKMRCKTAAIFVSTFLFLFSIAFGVTVNGFTLGDEILTSIHLPAWSNGNTGTHNTVFYSFFLLVLSLTYLFRYCNLLQCIKKRKYIFLSLLLFLLLMILLLVVNLRI